MGGTHIPFLLVLPGEAGCPRGTLMSYKGMAMLPSSVLRKTLLQCCSASLGEAVHQLGVGRKKSLEKSGPYMNVNQSEVNISVLTWFTLQASLLAFWAVSKQGGEMNYSLPSAGIPVTHTIPLCVTLRHNLAFWDWSDCL